MLIQIKTLVARMDSGFATDALGAAALMVILVAGLHLPTLV